MARVAKAEKTPKRFGVAIAMAIAILVITVNVFARARANEMRERVFWDDPQIQIFPSTGGSPLGGTYTLPPKYAVFGNESTYYAEYENGAIHSSGSVASTVIQYAFDHLTAGRTWKERVYMKGNFTITNKINIPSYVVWDGDALLKLANNQPVANTIMAEADNQHDIIIQNLIFDGNYANNLGATSGNQGTDVYITASYNVYIHNCQFNGGRRYGLVARSSDYGYDVSNVVVDSCTFLNDQWNGLEFSRLSASRDIWGCSAINNYFGGSIGDIALNTYCEVGAGTTISRISFINNVIDNINGTLGSSGGPNFAIRLEGSQTCEVSHNTILNAKAGILDSHLVSSYGNHTITDNIIYLDDNSENGGILIRTNLNFVSGNRIFGSPTTACAGITLDTADYNIIQGNTIISRGGSITGINGLSASNNNITGNNITNNEVGISLINSSSNAIFHNSFINNAHQVTEGINAWDNGYPSGGNFWSNYTGIDVKSGPDQDQPGSDGIGDTPYILDLNNFDRYPLMSPLDEISPTTRHDYDGAWHTTDFTINLIATDDMSGVAQTYYRINDGPTKAVSADGQPLMTAEGASSTLEYWSVDNAGNEERHHILTGIKLDKAAPTGTITINNDATYTTSNSVMLTLTSTDTISGVHQVRYSNDGVWDTESWETPSPTKTWTISSGDGTKAVYCQIKDNAGLISITCSDTITLDTTPPIGSIRIAGGEAYTNSLSVALTLSADDATSGVAQMRFRYDDNATWDNWEPYVTSKLWSMSQGDGTKTIYVQFMDKAGLNSPTYQETVTLDTTKPTANAGADQIVDEDTLVAFDASASTDENGIEKYTWTFTDITPRTLSGKKLTYTFANPGTYTIILKVTDLAGNTETDNAIIKVLDMTKPIANAGSDRTVNEDTPMTLDGSDSSDNVAITAYRWAFTDATTKTLTEQKPAYTFNTPGVYVITLNVTDAAGNWATDTVVITVLDITRPVANAGQDRTVNVGASVSFDAGGSTDNVGIVSYQWDFGDGTMETGKTTTHTYLSPKACTLTLTVEDAAGNTATDTITITVRLVEPPPPAAPFPMWIAGPTVVTIAIAAAIVILWKKRK